MEQVWRIVSLGNSNWVGEKPESREETEERWVRKAVVWSHLVQVQVADLLVPESITGVQRERCWFHRHARHSRITMAGDFGRGPEKTELIDTETDWWLSEGSGGGWGNWLKVAKMYELPVTRKINPRDAVYSRRVQPAAQGCLGWFGQRWCTACWL